MMINTQRSIDPVANTLIRRRDAPTAALIGALLFGFAASAFAQKDQGICVTRQDLTANAAGIVTAVHKKSGDPVKAGDLLVTLDKRLLLAGLKEGEAALEVARAHEQLAKDAFDRVQKLTVSDMLSDQQKVESRLKLAQARASRAQAEAALERLKIQISDAELRAEIPGTVRGLPEVKGLFVQYGQSLGYVEAAKQSCQQ